MPKPVLSARQRVELGLIPRTRTPERVDSTVALTALMMEIGSLPDAARVALCKTSAYKQALRSLGVGQADLAAEPCEGCDDEIGKDDEGEGEEEED